MPVQKPENRGEKRYVKGEWGLQFEDGSIVDYPSDCIFLTEQEAHLDLRAMA